jgi:hypothetical protein
MVNLFDDGPVERANDRRFSIDGPGNYWTLVKQMKRAYVDNIPLVPATTSESVEAAALNFWGDSGIASRSYDEQAQAGLYLGPVVVAQEGVFANTKSTNERVLKSILGKCKKVNGIWLYEGDDPELKDVGFAPYKSFKTGKQSVRTFLKGGLAGILEHNPTSLDGGYFKEILAPLLSCEEFKVFVLGDGDVKKPVLRVASIDFRDAADNEGNASIGVCYGYNGNMSGFIFGKIDPKYKSSRQLVQ